MFFNRKRPLSDLFTDNYIDIHSHVLPGLDDGAKTMEHSMQLIRALRELGIKNLITTPHVMGEVYPNTPESIHRQVALVKQELQTQEITDVKLQAAAEYMLDNQFSGLLKNRELLVLKDAYVLVELSYFSPPLNLKELIFELQLGGYTPVLAHPERYLFWHRNTKMLDELKAVGCKFQLNLLSMTKHYGDAVQKTAAYLLKKKQIDFVGTDVHHLQHIKMLHQKIDAKLFALLEEAAERNARLMA